ncbi:hypothetical protein CEXT_161721 [Caerostris extrusa]|uniref:Uncharacterized protein n=1 Tax=Caerostris extrusa TaxID=172846 RepID=A0AAV4Y0J9_CAEEX|nr:hypothetical protein CEXT_161721 [Caerostris extrusa]
MGLALYAQARRSVWILDLELRRLFSLAAIAERKDFADAVMQPLSLVTQRLVGLFKCPVTVFVLSVGVKQSDSIPNDIWKPQGGGCRRVKST